VTFPEVDSVIPDWWPKETCRLCRKQEHVREVQINHCMIGDHLSWEVRSIGRPLRWEYMDIGNSKYLPICPDCYLKALRP
jgi:hypothetical protein